ncbi:MAG: Ig-like domain-containing protein [bacterium]
MSQAERAVTFAPTGPLQQDKTYTIRIEPGLADAFGNTSIGTFT